jgi:hypothetical protein
MVFGAIVTAMVAGFKKTIAAKKKNIYFGMTSKIDGTSTNEMTFLGKSLDFPPQKSIKNGH